MIIKTRGDGVEMRTALRYGSGSHFGSIWCHNRMNQAAVGLRHVASSEMNSWRVFLQTTGKIPVFLESQPDASFPAVARFPYRFEWMEETHVNLKVRNMLGIFRWLLPQLADNCYITGNDTMETAQHLFTGGLITAGIDERQDSHPKLTLWQRWRDDDIWVGRTSQWLNVSWWLASPDACFRISLARSKDSTTGKTAVTLNEAEPSSRSPSRMRPWRLAKTP